MWSDLPLFPERASSVAGRVDALYFFLVGVTAFFSVLIFALVFYFALKYRRRSENERPAEIAGSTVLELVWTFIPFVLVMIMFVWGASIYFHNARPPAGSMEIYVVGKQWMWKLQHPEGRREINELHIPVGVPVKLVMTSEDVIHSFFIPAFRIKQDALPGRYTTTWFEATKPGKYHLFCAEYCGNHHSGMVGTVTVLEKPDYEAWLTGGGTTPESMASAGEALFEQLGCSNCHRSDDTGRGPTLVGLPGKPVTIEGGGTVIANEAYLRESIVNPAAKIVLGYKALMPTFQGQVSEEQILQLLAYIKSLKKAERTATR